LGVANLKQDANAKAKADMNTVYQKTEPAKPIKKEEIIKNLPITSRNKNFSKMGTTNFNNTTLLSESNDIGKKNLSNKLNSEIIKKNISRRNLSV